MEFLDEIIERLRNKSKQKQITIFDIIDYGGQDSEQSGGGL